MRLLPARTATALLTAAFGQVGAPDTWRVWTTKSGLVSAGNPRLPENRRTAHRM
jgi:hypothetical protein